MKPSTTLLGHAPLRRVAGTLLALVILSAAATEPLMANGSRMIDQIEESRPMPSDSSTRNEPHAQSSDSDNMVLIELLRTLENAYGNAARHDTASPDPEVIDLLLENASIRLSSRVLSALNTGACHPDQPETTGTACVLDDDSTGLRNLTDTLSYAAGQLQRVTRSTGIRPGTDASEAARIQSMEHLYRMTYAISKAYLDRSQSHAYLDAAHEQLDLACKYIQSERNLRPRGSDGYSARLHELSELDNRLSLMRTPDDSQ